MRTYVGFTIFLVSSLFSSFARAEDDSKFALTGDVSLLSQYIEYGLNQTDHSPALQASFWFNAGPQFRLGAWGSNTNYENEEDVFNLRLNADIDVSFTPTAGMTILYNRSFFYNAGERNGDILGIYFNFSQFSVTFDQFSNWEGTKRSSERYGFKYRAKITTLWNWDNFVGYNTPNIDALDPYFDFKTALGTHWGAILLQGAVTATSNSSQLNDRGNVYFILSASTEL